MADFETMYRLLFRAASETIEAIRAGEPTRGVVLLTTAQWEAEALYIETDNTSV